MIIRQRSGLGLGCFMGALLLLIAFMIISFAEEGRAVWFVVPLSSMGLTIMFVHPRIELDFENHRFRTYMLFTTVSDFKVLPHLDRIQVRDITYPGGRAGEELPGSWSDSHSYEIFLMSVANEKLVVCERQIETKVKTVVDELVKASGLPVRDVTKDQILKAAKR